MEKWKKARVESGKMWIRCGKNRGTYCEWRRG